MYCSSINSTLDTKRYLNTDFHPSAVPNGGCRFCVAGNRGPDQGYVGRPYHGKRRALPQVRNAHFLRFYCQADTPFINFSAVSDHTCIRGLYLVHTARVRL